MAQLIAVAAIALFLLAVGFLGFALSQKVMMVFAVGWIALMIFGFVGAIRVAKGDFAHPLFKALKAAAPGLLGSEGIKWNFTKFLVGRDGQVIKRYASLDKPASLAADIEQALSQA
jgi:hypothetical protein